MQCTLKFPCRPVYVCTCHLISSPSVEANQNLFKKPKVVFDSPTPPMFQQSWQYYPPTSKPVADTVIRLGSQSSRKRDSSGSEELDHCAMIVSLDDVYIVNYLHMKGYPGVPVENQKYNSFSYTVEVSRDKSNWLKLFDYSSFACRGAQDLPFFKQAVK